ncbi:hypothetical protein MKX03_030398 [Papaver bracteatum]|nr:hypothetical protein MKX03_030398 [Papaver bracteatum]
MGLSNLPAPADGVLCVILVNTAQSISIFKGMLFFILQIIGIHLQSSTESVQNSSGQCDLHITSDTLVEQLRKKIPSIPFSSLINGGNSDTRSELHDCTVCLNRFQPDSEVNHLSCGHFFHKDCLEKWLDYWNITCPLCRTPLLSDEDQSVDDDDDDQETYSCLWNGN